MKRIFAVDGKIYKLLENLSDYVLLNVAFVLGCLPLLTIGAALTALYDITERLQNGEKVRIFRDYFSSYAAHFRTSTFIWVIQFIFYLIIFLYVMMFQGSESLLGKIYYVFTVLMAYINTAVALYVYPVISRYRNNIAGYVRLAFVSSHMFIYYTIIMMAVFAVLAFVVFSSAAFIGWSMFIFLTFGFAVLAYIYNLMFSRVFERLEKNNG